MGSAARMPEEAEFIKQLRSRGSGLHAGISGAEQVRSVL